MKILFASRRPVYPFFLGGAERSFFELAASLTDHGHSVCMMGDYTGEVGLAERFFNSAEVEYTKWYHEDMEFLGRKVPRILRLEMKGPGGMFVFHNFLPDLMPLMEDIMETFKPDLICTQLEGAVEVMRVARNWNIPVLHFVRDIFNPVNYFPLGLKYPVPGPTVCVANSEFVKGYVESHYDVETVTIYPLIRFAEPIPKVPSRPRKRILFINPIPSKGGDVIYEVAKEVPEVDFELIPGWAKECDPEWRALPNVIIQEWPVPEMQQLLSKVDIVIFPAQESEAFGRVGIEAQTAGVPVIASRHSGISESLGDSAILVEDYKKPSAWVEAIRGLIADPAQMERLVAKGRQNIERFSEAKILKMFDHAASLAFQKPTVSEVKR